MSKLAEEKKQNVRKRVVKGSTEKLSLTLKKEPVSLKEKFEKWCATLDYILLKVAISGMLIYEIFTYISSKYH
ncbi:MAG TPA: hypothetical protein VF602_12580 [Pedobacter sp.]|jgi:hypothetical protein